MAQGEASVAEAGPMLHKAFDLLLEPEACPAAGVIRIDEDLFAVGRFEAPFVAYETDAVAQLSRRHARIFIENGAAYAADLGSKNGTTVNGVLLRDKPARIHSGDVIGFGGKLAFRVRMEPRAASRAYTSQPVHMTLTPERGDLGLHPVELMEFPFLVSKADETFAQYSDRYPHQVNYVSRRHAHIFMKAGVPFVEDLGSTNGTFVDGKRLGETAVPLQDGASLAFGGNHFAYIVSLRREAESDAATTTSAATTTATGAVAQSPLDDLDKTTFIATAHSFLDIFCVDQGQPSEDEINREPLPDARAPARRRSRNKFVRFVSDLSAAFGGDRPMKRRVIFIGLAFVAAMIAIGSALYFSGTAERNLKSMVEHGDYRHAVIVANTYLGKHPNDPQAMVLGTEALLKGYVPDWLDQLKHRSFDAAHSVVSQMNTLAATNADARFLVDEIAWIGRLETFMASREKADAPIRIYADENRMTELLKQWESDPSGHQRRLDRIASTVPAFRDLYAIALSHLRKLESDDSVYLAAIERLKASIDKALAPGGDPDALSGEIADYADKYPRLAGLDHVQDDLRQYLALEHVLQSRQLGPMIDAMQKARFTTPPFQAQQHQLDAKALPAPDVVQRYLAVSNAWNNGKTETAIAGLRSMAGGPWADAVSTELAHKQAVASQFADLQKSRGAQGYDDRVLSFYESLDLAADAWFVNAIQPDLTALRQKALARADDGLSRAQTAWTQYRTNGAIGGDQRLETGLSDTFRKQAKLLTDAWSGAQRAAQLLHQLKADRSAFADKLLAEISAEVDLQRRSLVQLSSVLDPGILSAKLALIDGDKNANKGANGEERRAP
ncbi:FHA domain-containing protein [Caballeronia sp. 15711]|uniref:FHA domain-containing protein n=1 Tax=Caballeronia sp. 15711 TaxID=3391029 RepID=UPI0039E4AC00